MHILTQVKHTVYTFETDIFQKALQVRVVLSTNMHEIVVGVLHSRPVE